MTRGTRRLRGFGHRCWFGGFLCLGLRCSRLFCLNLLSQGLLLLLLYGSSLLVFLCRFLLRLPLLFQPLPFRLLPYHLLPLLFHLFQLLLLDSLLLRNPGLVSSLHSCFLLGSLLALERTLRRHRLLRSFALCFGLFLTDFGSRWFLRKMHVRR